MEKPAGLHADEWTEALRITQARARVAALRWPCDDPQERGRLAELILCSMFGWAAWGSLPLQWRCAVSRGRGGDRGVDAVGISAGAVCFIQIKWYGAGGQIWHDPVARLGSLAAEYCSAFADRMPARVVCTPPDVQIGDVPGLASTVHLTADRAALDTKALELLHQAPGRGALPDYSFQDDAVKTMLAACGPTVRARLPPAAGKSQIIAALVAHHSKSGPVVVLAPRRLIVDQLLELLASRGLAPVCVCDGAVQGSTSARVYVASANSARALPALQWAAVVRDEAHVNNGQKWFRRLSADTRVYELSATLPGAVDYELSMEELIRRNCACAPEFIFAVHAEEPAHADICAHLVEHPEYRSVLACFQKQDGAHKFVAQCAHAGISAASCVSSDMDDGNEALRGFCAGELRVLAMVARAEMGVNMHVCDTVLFVEPWESETRTLQLAGRGMRLGGAKLGTFVVLTPMAEAAARDMRLRKYLEAMSGCGFAAAAAGISVCPLLQVRCDAEIETAEGKSAEREEVFDRIGAAALKSFGAAAPRSAEERFAQARLEISKLGALAPGTPEEYFTFRAGVGEARRAALPADPAAEFEFSCSARCWGALLGLPEKTPNATVTDVEALRSVIAELEVASVEEAGPGPALYSMMRQKAPGLPPRIEQDWSEYFAGLEAALTS